MIIWTFQGKELSLLLNLVSAAFGLGGMVAPQVRKRCMPVHGSIKMSCSLCAAGSTPACLFGS